VAPRHGLFFSPPGYVGLALIGKAGFQEAAADAYRLVPRNAMGARRTKGGGRLTPRGGSLRRPAQAIPQPPRRGRARDVFDLPRGPIAQFFLDPTFGRIRRLVPRRKPSWFEKRRTVSCSGQKQKSAEGCTPRTRSGL